MKRAFLIVVLVWLFALVLFLAHPAGAAPHFDTFSSQPADGKDTSMISVSATSNFGSAASLFVGRDEATLGVRRALVAFDLSSVPGGAVVTGATLSLWVKLDAADVDLYVHAYRVKRDWSESTSTWNIYSTGNNWTGAGASNVADYDNSSWGFAVVPNNAGVGTQVDIALDVAEVQKFLDGTYVNYGWVLRAASESGDAFNFYSSEEVTETGRRPRLVIDYVVPTATPTATITSTATVTPTGVPTVTPTFSPELDYEPGAPDFEFWWRWITGMIFIVSGMYWQGVFWFFILPYLFTYGQMEAQMIVMTFIFLYGAGLYRNLVKDRDV